MKSHIFKPAQDVSSDEKEDIPVPEPQYTSPPLVPLTDPYFTLLVFVIQLTLSHNQLYNDFYSTGANFTSSQRLFVQHLTQIQHHLGYEIPPPSQYIHPLPPTDPLFPPYDPWPTLAVPPQGDTDPIGSASDSF